MLTSGRGFRRSLFGLFLGGAYLGLGGLAMAWIQPPQDYPDVAIGSGPANQVAIDPADPNHVVIGGSRSGEVGLSRRCAVYVSADAGETWNLAPDPPQCAWPVAVTYARSGGIIYVAYGNSTHEAGLNFSLSIDQGATWSAPTTLVSPLGRWGYSGSLRLAAGSDGSLYAVFSVVERSHSGFYCNGLYVSASTDEGASWSDAHLVDSVCLEDGERFAGSFSVAAGSEGNTIVAYGLDSWEPGYRELTHDYALQIAKSTDYGASFVYGTVDRFTSNLLESEGLYDPDIIIARGGMARVVYVERGEAILYKISRPPYDKWSDKPGRLNPDVTGAGVGSPSLAVGDCGSTNILHAVWSDRVNGTLYTRKIALPGYRWSQPLQIAEIKYGFAGSGAITTSGAEGFALYSNVMGRPLYTTDIFGSWVWSGVTCP